MIDRVTKKWIRNDNDERAAKAGCWFSERAALHFIDFPRRFLRHSKGEWANQTFELLPWQRDDVFMPIYGWMRPRTGSTKKPLRRYRRAFVEIPKKNGKSTMASVVGLYMLVGDGEIGAQVFSAAADQKQASIVHGEAITMAESSPALAKILRINKTTKVITYEKTHSAYSALSSVARTKEGFDAHCIIADELHIWPGRDLWDALKYAFAARSQPLLFSITTAGDDTQSVCFEQLEYSRGVLDGSIVDERHFAYIAEATEEDDWQDDEEVWKKANPSLGVTIKLDDFRADVEEAKTTPATVSAFKRYRLNIWSTSTNPWLREGAWKACKTDFSIDDLEGEICYGGLDLSKSQDMTSFVLVFPRPGDVYRVFPWFWLPRAAVDCKDAPDYLRRWEESGHLTITEGDVVDYPFVEAAIAELAGRFGLQAFAYDPYNAEHLTQSLQENHGLERVSFPQTIMAFTGPMTECERLIYSKKLQHNSHPILDWQAGHVQAKPDANCNIRPVKPKPKDRRKIDGIVAMLMGLGLAMKQDGGGGIQEAIWF